MNQQLYFVVSLHDVTPGAEREILRQWAALAALVGSTLSVAVIPAPPGAPWKSAGTEYRHTLAGAERLLHGYGHARNPTGSLVSRACGHADEFAGLSRPEARRRLGEGQRIMADTFAAPARGFLPPAWRAGPVDAALLRECHLDFAVGFRTVRGARKHGIRLATFAWDFGPVAAIGRLGAPLGRVMARIPGAVPVVALHPCDEARGFLGHALREISRLLDAGYVPTTFEKLPGELRMRSLMDALMFRRAHALVTRLLPHLPHSGTVLDVGSGTGHNALAMERLTGLRVTELDVVDMNSVGRATVVYAGRDMPFAAASFSCITMLFALHYVPDPAFTLRELRRVAAGRIVILQSTFSSAWGRRLLAARELLQGRAAFHAAHLAQLIPDATCSLQPRHYFRRDELLILFAQAGLRPVHVGVSCGSWCGASRDLCVLEAD